jgi:CelD/BcsL family acetyltransferase involved in cellulose biosynthesis
MPVRLLAPPDPNAIAYSDFVYARTPVTKTLLPSLLRQLRTRSDLGWDIFTLPRMLSSPAEAIVTSADHGSPLSRYVRDKCYYFRCDQGIAAIQTQISSGLRKHLRRCRRQLTEMAKMEVVSSRNAAELPRLFHEFFELEASGWKGEAGEGTAIRLHADLTRFYSGLTSRFGETGGCEINLLRLDGRNIAGQFCLVSGGTWYHLKIAYDESLHRYSPGFVLLEDVLTRLCSDPSIHTANFLTGAEWADRWHPSQLEVSRVIGRNHTFFGALALQEVKARRFFRGRVIPLIRRDGRNPDRSATLPRESGATD